jgi:alkylation response protein AidB-like acyl-CoA dehydrogenase
MTPDAAAVLKAGEIASRLLVQSAAQDDKSGRFATEAVESLGKSGLLGLLLPVGCWRFRFRSPHVAIVTATLAEADASVAIVNLRHILGTATISAGRPSAAQALTPCRASILPGTQPCLPAGR